MPGSRLCSFNSFRSRRTIICQRKVASLLTPTWSNCKSESLWTVFIVLFNIFRPQFFSFFPLCIFLNFDTMQTSAQARYDVVVCCQWRNDTFLVRCPLPYNVSTCMQDRSSHLDTLRFFYGPHRVAFNSSFQA